MVSHNYQAHIFNAIVGVDQLVCENVFMASIGQMKGQHFNTIEMFVNELYTHFPNCELMNSQLGHFVSTILETS